MKHKSWKIGAAEAAGVALYIAAFAFLAEKFRFFAGDTDPAPMVAMAIFLLAFSTSALICGIIVFGYPFSLFMEGKKREAAGVIIWSAVFLAAISLVYILAVLGV